MVMKQVDKSGTLTNPIVVSNNFRMFEAKYYATVVLIINWKLI